MRRSTLVTFLALVSNLTIAFKTDAAEEKNGASLEERDRAISDYLGRSFPGRLTDVRLTDDKVIVTGKVYGGPLDSIYLCEIKPYEHVESTRTLRPVAGLTLSGMDLSISMDRFVNGKDRICSKWVFAQRKGIGYEIISNALYPTDLTAAAKWKTPDEKPKNKKGMGGVDGDRETLSELAELGIHNVTVNILINRLIVSASDEGAIKHEHNGNTYWISAPQTARLDTILKFASDNQIIAAAIILVGTNHKPGDPAAALVHPDYVSPGRYSMANVATEAGVECYAAVIDFLAGRFSRHVKDYGRIAHWIIHNEVVAGWDWTNAGGKPLGVYMDDYVKSMRIVYYVARKYNPHAKVFISLTHGWSKPVSSGSHFYSSKDMVDLLQEYSRVEGDFEWGIAYHPYPESLLKADTWNDKTPTFSFDTEMITMKNIEVLDAYIHQDEYLYDREKVRTVLLSEQGFHTPDYSETSQRLQAAALVYTWHKIRPLESIEAFNYHRWVDHTGEFGLLLGLWTSKEGTVNTRDRKKLAWDVYKALDTPEEADATAFAKEIIGVEDLSDIPYKGKIAE